MFADNEKISSRQCMRLLFFDFIGIGSLVLPGRLAKICGTDGVLALLLGALAGAGYLFLLGKAGSVMDGDLLGYLHKQYGGISMRITGILYGLYYLLLGSYTLHLFTTLMMRSLLREESYWMIAALALLLAAYGMCRGLECRSRVFEILFWIILIPLLLMLLLGATDLQWTNLLPMGMTDGGSLLLGSYLVFLIFSLSQLLLHLGSAIPVEKGRRAAGMALWLGCFVFLFLYVVLLGVFGGEAISVLDFPAVSLMSTVTIPGGFLRRQDAIMVSIWFFSLFALICSSLYYCCKSGQKIISLTGKKKVAGALFLMALIYGVAWSCYLMPEVAALLETFFFRATPLYLVFPLLIALPGRRKKQLAALALTLLCACSFCGCSVQELENRSFPLAVGIGEKDGECHLVYKFEDLSAVSSREGTDAGSMEQDAYASGFYPAMTAYERENGKVMDLNHVKVIIFEQDFLENEQMYEDFLAYMKQSQDISWNTLLFVTKDVGAITDLQENMTEPIGTYLEEMQEGNSQLDEKKLVTLGSLLNDSSNRRKNLLIPYLKEEKKLPIQEGFYCVSAGRPVGRISEEQGELANIFTKTTTQLELTLRAGCNVVLEDFKVSYEHMDDGECRVKLSAVASHYGNVAVTEKEIEKVMDQKLQKYFGEYLAKEGLDLTASFDELPVYAPEKARRYAGNKAAYEAQLALSFATDVDLVAGR